jgi:hypothetical protein
VRRIVSSFAQGTNSQKKLLFGDDNPRNEFTIPARETNSQKLATRSLLMTKITNDKMRAGE